MTTLADVIAAIRTEDGTSWAVADAVAGLPETDEHGRLTLERIATAIYDETGTEWSTVTLGKYRATARAFPSGIRIPLHTFHVHMELRAHPAKLLGWTPKGPGDVLTVERARALRGPASAGKAKPDAWRTELKRAFTVIDRLAERDPVFVLDMLTQTIATVERTHGRALRKAGRSDLRAV